MNWTKRELSAMETVKNFGTMTKGQLIPLLLRGTSRDKYFEAKRKLLRNSRKTLLGYAVNQFKTEGWAK